MNKKWMMMTTLLITITLVFTFIYIKSNSDIHSSIIIHGEGLNKLSSPMAAAADDQNLYIANTSKNQISVFNRRGEYQYPIGITGIGDGQLLNPVDVEVFENNIYVADLENRRIQIFTKQGQFLDWFPRERNIKPAAIDIQDEQIYVSDVYSHTIKIYSLTGKLLNEFAENGSSDGQLNYANGIAVSDNGKIIAVSDSQNQRIQLFSTAGEFLEVLPIKVKLGFPKGLAIEGNSIFVSDYLNQKIYTFDFDGKLLEEVKSKVGRFVAPNDVYFLENNMFITDMDGDQVVVMKKKGGGWSE